MLTLMLGEVSKGQITLPFVARIMAENPAKIYGLATKGRIAVGLDADFAVVDMRETHTIRNEELHSKEPMTAFDGLEVTGWPVRTYLRGQLIMQDRKICEEKPIGQKAPLCHNETR
jgi:dihydroorotase-like cyclic amidohydrolase